MTNRYGTCKFSLLPTSTIVLNHYNELEVCKPHDALGFLLSRLHHKDCVTQTILLLLRESRVRMGLHMRDSQGTKTELLPQQTCV